MVVQIVEPAPIPADRANRSRTDLPLNCLVTAEDLITNSHYAPSHQVVPEATGELAPELIQSTSALVKWKNIAAVVSRAT